MRNSKILALPVVAALVLGSGLSGCATLGTVTQGGVPTAAEIQADAVQLCGYEPSLASLTQVIISATAHGASGAAAAAGLTLGDFIAKSVCGVVTAKSGLGRVPALYGVRVYGHFK